MAKLVYVAGPLFSRAEQAFLEEMVEALATAAGLDPVGDFFLPHRDAPEFNGVSWHNQVFHLEIQSVDAATIVVALLDGHDVDSGASVELGYAYARNKKLFGLLTDFRAQLSPAGDVHRPNIMVWGVCEKGLSLYWDLPSLAGSFAQYVRHHLKESCS